MARAEASFYAVGDIRVDRDDPESLFAYVAPVLKEGDVVFAQLEASYSERGEIAITLSPGMKAHPRNVPAIAHAGINVISVASNHSADYGHDAFLDTINYLKKEGIKVIGGGKNIEEARTPAIFDVRGTKIALLGYNAILQPGYEARPNKPGMAPLRVVTFYEQIDWQPGTPPKIWTIPNADDVAAIENDIHRARDKADIVVVSIHWGVHFVPGVLAMYQTEVGHKVIDAGADLLLGHHAHQLNQLEVYKGKVIFYCLGNFAFDYHISWDSEDPYVRALKEHYKLSADPNFTASQFPAITRAAMIVKCDISDKKIQRISFLPTMANDDVQPQVVSPKEKAGKDIVDYMTKYSEGLGAKFVIDGDEVVITSK